ncbi:site-specific DNA-methyltransferase [Micropruina glycogenica]|uniref:DNA methyltransferase n=1 Tax=Micropruina glycogenica TaxID=75385 RepID=A0A2N9JCS4_9ACTN|nr:DNA methyltransferase [Micropruina glycogenica]SPD85275.1 DNA methyltransferase [Micropruina glycogenica]
MSRLSDLIREAKRLDAGLGNELEKEVRHLQERRAFGLNFERHQPEAVDLYGRPVRVGDKVRMLPPRGETAAPDKRLWVVTGGATVDGQRRADLRDPKTGDTATHPVDDLVVVAENTDVIYPGLVSTGKVERGGDKPFHTVINAENLHALEALLYTHRGKVDAIYIDPPYNTGAKDWKYNNDYVEGDDLYRHSKWLAFMERRLKLAKELLNPEDSVLIVTIDEKEYLRLGLLLEQTFPGDSVEMVTTVISAKGVARFGQFSRVEEYIFCVRLGQQEVGLSETNMLDESRSASAQIGKPVDWLGLRRREPSARRGARPKQFYPVFVDSASGFIHSVGDFITDAVDRHSIEAPPGTFAVWPLLPNGTEGLWGVTPDTARSYLSDGYLRSRNYKPEKRTVAVQYLPSGTVAAIRAGDINVEGRDESGGVIATYRTAKGVIPKRVWNMTSHNAETQGTNLLSVLLPGRRFPFPKSIYGVEDTLRFFTKDKPGATVIDFFSGSGTTAQAIMRLNRQDGGRRTSIAITNNEVAADEQRALRQRGLRPGDPEWESLGICDYITKPRIEAAITGRTPSGDPIKGDYKFTDEFPMADGFEENAEFFTLTYEAPLTVSAGHAFARIAPLLWLRAGSRGRRIESLEDGWDVAEAYGVIERLDGLDRFVDALRAQPEAKVAFIVTDDERRFQSACAALPERVEPVRLYESYLRNFQIDAVRSSR